jgi:hypothetical protein
MSIGTIIKRGFQGLGCLMLIGFGGLAALSAYVSHIERDPEAQARLHAAGEAAEHRIDPDASALAKLGVLFDIWWNADELQVDQELEEALKAKAEADREKAEEERRFNSTVPPSDDDYYSKNAGRN